MLQFFSPCLICNFGEIVRLDCPSFSRVPVKRKAPCVTVGKEPVIRMLRHIVFFAVEWGKAFDKNDTFLLWKLGEFRLIHQRASSFLLVLAVTAFSDAAGIPGAAVGHRINGGFS